MMFKQLTQTQRNILMMLAMAIGPMTVKEISAVLKCGDKSIRYCNSTVHVLRTRGFIDGRCVGKRKNQFRHCITERGLEVLREGGYYHKVCISRKPKMVACEKCGKKVMGGTKFRGEILCDKCLVGDFVETPMTLWQSSAAQWELA